MWCIVGLGNPGKEHENQRHNIGFMAIDALADQFGAGAFSAKFQGEVAKTTIAGESCLLLKPQTFMNLSGQSVQAACGFYKVAPEQVIVIHDELALDLGKLRIKKGGGHNGHNGLKDIDRHLGKDYWRMRLGIAHPGDKSKVTRHVLSDFSADEQPILHQQIEDIARYMEVFFTHSPEAFMSKISEHQTPEPAKKSSS